jgi:hypothetical protein
MIQSFNVRGGTSPWREAVMEWTGDSEIWVVRNAKTGAVLYNDTGFRYDLTVSPEQVYIFTLTDDVETTVTTTWASAPVGSPTGVVFSNITPYSATISWNAVVGANQYEVVDADSGIRLGLTATTAYSRVGLEPDTEYSVKVKALYGSLSSPWSLTKSVTTLRSGTIPAGVYEFYPYAGVVWTSINSWQQWRSQLRHGDGRLYGDLDGVCTTEFYYPESWFRTIAPLGQFKELNGATIVQFQVFLRRFPDGSDPRAMLSHWSTHSRTAPAGSDMWAQSSWPPVAQVVPVHGVDSGILMLNEGGWIDLPLSWAENFCSLSPDVPLRGITWGGVGGRYQTAAIPYGESDELNDEEDPPNGALRIVVA